MSNIFGDDFTNRILKSAKLGGQTLNEDAKPKKHGKVNLDEIKTMVRSVIREELQKSPDELNPAAPAPGEAPEAPLPGGDLGGDMPGELPAEDGAAPVGLPGEGLPGEGGMDEGGPLASLRSSIEGLDWASISDEDVETLIQDIATGKWGESTEVETEGEDLPGEQSAPGTETIGGSSEQDVANKPPM